MVIYDEDEQAAIDFMLGLDETRAEQAQSALTADETLDLLANLKVAATICESYVPDMKTHERLRHYIDKLGGTNA